jgi:hypothetical protein
MSARWKGPARPETDGCTLFELFPYVAQAILATESDRIEPYIEAIRENVCSVCIEARLDGSCPKREDRCCALDTYLGPIVEAISEATGKTFASAERNVR